MTAAFQTVKDQLEASAEEPNHEQVMRTLDQMLEFLQGGLAALQKN